MSKPRITVLNDFTDTNNAGIEIPFYDSINNKDINKCLYNYNN